MEGNDVTQFLGNVLHSLKTIMSLAIGIIEKILVVALFGIDKLATTLLIVMTIDLATGILYQTYNAFSIPRITNDKLVRKGIIFTMVALAGTLDEILKNVGVDFGGIISARNYMVLYFIMSEALHAYSNMERLSKKWGGWLGPEPKLLKKIITKAIENIEFPNVEGLNNKKENDKKDENK